MPSLFLEKKISVNWLHIFSEPSALSNPREAANYIKKLNNSGNGAHITIDSFIGFKVIHRSIKNYFGMFKNLSTSKVILGSRNYEYDYLWKLHELDFLKSITGPEAMRNIVKFHLFEKAMCSLSVQDLGFYLMENQGWEFAFLHSWKSSNHKKIVGCPHSSMRFWDLRYFFDKRDYNQNRKYPMPLPNQVAVNGKMALNMYKNSSFPEKKLTELEALRFMHLNKIKKNDNKKSRESIISKKILIVGEYNLDDTKPLLNLFFANWKEFTKHKIFFKPHPQAGNNKLNFPQNNFKVTHQNMDEILPEMDIIVTGTTSSVALEALLCGKLLIVLLNEKKLNLSPVRGMKEPRFICSADEFSKIINSNIIYNKLINFDVGELFYLDENLKRWKNFLNNNL